MQPPHEPRHRLPRPRSLGPRFDGWLSRRRSRRPTLTPVPTDGRPQVIAHRGASFAAAEHTLAAYQRALQQGADGVECDVRLTADGHLVCVHDRRIDRTSSGYGPVSILQLEELEAMDWETWRSPWPGFAADASTADVDADTSADTDPDPRATSDPDPNADPSPDPSAVLDATDAAEGDGESTPPPSLLTLERLLNLVKDMERPVEVAIETKHPTRYAGLVERRLIELLDRYGWARPRRGVTSPVRVLSFSWMSLRRCLDMAPGLPMVYLMDRVPLRFRDGSLPLGVSAAGPSIDIVRAHPEYVEKVQSAGHEVLVWVANTSADVDLCARLGVDALLTDDPAGALRQLADRNR